MSHGGVSRENRIHAVYCPLVGVELFVVVKRQVTAVTLGPSSSGRCCQTFPDLRLKIGIVSMARSACCLFVVHKNLVGIRLRRGATRRVPTGGVVGHLVSQKLQVLVEEGRAFPTLVLRLSRTFRRRRRRHLSLRLSHSLSGILKPNDNHSNPETEHPRQALHLVVLRIGVAVEKLL